MGISWAVVVDAVAKILPAIVLKLLGMGGDDQRKTGQIEQQHADLTASQKNMEAAREVERTVDAADDAELGKLRDKWTVPAASRSGPASE